MKFIRLSLLSILAFSFLNQLSLKSLKRKKDNPKECKTIFQDCTYQTFGSECCEGYTCDVYQLSPNRQEWGYRHYDANNTKKGKCKRKQGQECDIDYQEKKNIAICDHTSDCKEPILKPGSFFCIVKVHSPKLFD